MQAATETGAYPSDVTAHAMFVRQAETFQTENYSLFHVAAGTLARIADRGIGASDYFAINGMIVLLLSGAFYVSLNLVYSYWKERYESLPTWRVSIVTCALFFVSMLLFGPGVSGGYVGNWTPNPWHNPTYLFSRAFAVAIFIGYLRFRASPATQSSLRHCVEIALVGALCMWAKPSFLMAFLPAFAALSLLDLFSRQATISVLLKWSAALLPAMATMLLVWLWVFQQTAPDEEPSHVIFSPGTVWKSYAPQPLAALLTGLAFPIYVVIMRCRHFNRSLATGFAYYLSSAAVFYFLNETGPRASHANFAWTYMFGMFFFFFSTMEDWFLHRAEPRKVHWWIGVLLFAAHLGSGGYYFIRILQGGRYV